MSVGSTVHPVTAVLPPGVSTNWPTSASVKTLSSKLPFTTIDGPAKTTPVVAKTNPTMYTTARVLIGYLPILAECFELFSLDYSC